MIKAPGMKTFSGAFYGGTMNVEQYLKYLVEEIHTSVVATVDSEGLPVTAAIDFSETPAVIAKEHCLHCGNCAAVCPVSAVERR